MKTRLKALMVALLFVVGAGVAVVAPAETAYAAGECNGGSHSGYVLVGQYNMSKTGGSGSKTGTLEVYWSNAEGRNCAIARAYGSNYGQRLWRGVSVNVSGSATVGSDWGYYSYYAGPAYSGNSRGKCIDAGARFETSGGSLVGYRNVSRVHCG